MKNYLNDPRYTVTSEYCGQEKPMWIARFEGEWIGKAEKESSAWLLCIIDQDERFNLGIISEKKEYSRDEILKISENMRVYGGSFMSAIGEALVRADSENTKKLTKAFAKEFERYLNF